MSLPEPFREGDIDWQSALSHLDDRGFAVIPGRLGSERTRYPGTLGGVYRAMSPGGSKRPTPLMLKYGAGDFNCLHQDLYGEMVFPFQVTFFLSRRGKDFEGGEFVLAEQRPRNNPVSRCSLRTRATRSSLQFIIAPFAAREVITEPIFGTE